ncbi:MAG: hypothetical protein ACFFF4_07990 [Candidatus Thorarchaeota archaeon]
MEDDSPLSRLRRAVKKKLDETDEFDIIQEITNAIGDRRIRDLVDIIAREEITKGWSTVVDYLIQSEKNKYPVPVGYDAHELQIEPLKFREVLFQFFGCNGWEPVNRSTGKLLEEVQNTSSSFEATNHFTNEIVALTEEQISKSDTLFFDPYSLNHNVPKATVEAMQEAQNKATQDVRITKQEGRVNIHPLWITEYGRQALSNLGIHGTTIDEKEYDMVLSVLQVSKAVKNGLRPTEGTIDDKINTLSIPSNKLYNHLLESIISCDTTALANLGSRYSIPVLNYSIRDVIDQYKTKNDSDSFRNLVSVIRNHVAIRHIESIPLLSEIALENDNRLVTPCIMAIGNFYDSSAVSSLVNIICLSKSSEVRVLGIRSIDNIRSKCPESQEVIKNELSQNCRNVTELRKYYKEVWEK